tara:strand:- start:921 stop:1265 length:345 start_codon:yes stop_codon:yes gene_type:complete
MSEDTSNAEQLIGVLINKMESMDSNLMLLKAENDALKRLVNNPQRLLRKMGLVSVNTPFTEDLLNDPFRGDMELDNGSIIKSQPTIGSMSNEDVHSMSWEEIHEMAMSAKEVVQ